MMKYAAVIEYDGTRFHGWQSQPDARNVQDCVEAAFSQVAGHPIAVVCAGRTDAGVHSLGQVVHFATAVQRSIDGWRRGAGSFLPEDISISMVAGVSDDFHARYSAVRRYYRYVILNSTEKHALIRSFVMHVHHRLSAAAMHEAAQILIGEHDFSSFRAAGCRSRSPLRHVFEITVERHDDFIVIDICANAFVQHMVRNIVGSLVLIGKGTMPTEWLAQLLARRDRSYGGFAASSNGLYLVRVQYDIRCGLPATSMLSRILPFFCNIPLSG